MDTFLLLENGDYLLLETGDFIILVGESVVSISPGGKSTGYKRGKEILFKRYLPTSRKKKNEVERLKAELLKRTL